MKKTKIICSIGPASNPYDIFKKMVLHGMNVARINFSHATNEEREIVVANTKRVNQELGTHVAVLYDTKGPDFRTGKAQEGGISLEEGKQIRIVKEDIIGTEEAFTVNYKDALDDIHVGAHILLEDGLMELEVISKEEDGLTCVVISGGVLLDRKGVNVPGVKLNVPFISDQDREDIIYACQHGGDYLALSFVDEKEDVLQVREILKEQDREDMLIISKIESETAIDHIDDIIEVSDGIMVARGDLGVEVPVVNLPIYQKTIVEKCRAQGKFCIVATEMLSSMQKNARPTRAEVSDIANAVIDGTDAVMLSGETTTGKHPIEAVTYMANVCENTEKYLQYQDLIQTSFQLDVPATIAKGVVEITNDIDIEAIITATMTGYTARNISNLRPNTMIIAACPDDVVARKLSLNFGVYPTVVDLSGSTDEIIEKCLQQAKKQFQLKERSYVVVTGGFPNDTKKHHTNYLKIEMI